MLRVFDNIPIITTLDQVNARLKISEEDDIAAVSELFENASAVAKPKALYREVFVDSVHGDDVYINGIYFKSKVLAMNLKDIHRVFAYICTCGTEVDVWSKGESDYVMSLWLDIIKEMFLRDANVFLTNYLRNAYQMDKFSSNNPGSGDLENWPIAQQVQLFELIGGVKESIGVELTDSYLMVPIKSVSGLYFPTASGFVNCALCGRNNCVGRRAEFDAGLYERLHMDAN